MLLKPGWSIWPRSNLWYASSRWRWQQYARSLSMNEGPLKSDWHSEHEFTLRACAAGDAGSDALPAAGAGVERQGVDARGGSDWREPGDAARGKSLGGGAAAEGAEPGGAR